MLCGVEGSSKSICVRRFPPSALSLFRFHLSPFPPERPDTQANARVNLCEMSTYMSCWSWSVSQFSTYMTLLRHGCQRNSFWNSQTDSQMYTFPDQMNWQFVQILVDSKIPLKTSCTGHRWRKAKDFFVFCWGKIRLVLFQGCCSFVLHCLCPVHKIKSPNSHHNHPRHQFISWIYCECKAQNGLIL